MSKQLSFIAGEEPEVEAPATPRRGYVPITEELKLWNRVAIGAPDECWEWQGPLTRAGYAALSNRTGRVLGHRVAYQYVRGPIPEALVLDHLCRNRKCVNPSHLEPVTIAENVRRGVRHRSKMHPYTHCKYGHALEGENVAWSNGRKFCRICKRRRNREYRARLKAAENE